MGNGVQLGIFLWIRKTFKSWAWKYPLRHNLLLLYHWKNDITCKYAVCEFDENGTIRPKRPLEVRPKSWHSYLFELWPKIRTLETCYEFLGILVVISQNAVLLVDNVFEFQVRDEYNTRILLNNWLHE